MGKISTIPVGGENGGGVPVGFIGLWSGAANAIPFGWRLCDGTGGTPDLRNRFVIGAGSSYTVGATGGEATHKLVINETPYHSHTLQNNGVGYYGSGTSNLFVCSPGDSDTAQYGLSTNGSGGNQPHNNLPPYYALCYIMKL